jgi:hypothetical protein
VEQRDVTHRGGGGWVAGALSQGQGLASLKAL